MVKPTTGTQSWVIRDVVRGPINANNLSMYFDQSAAETTASTTIIDILSNGIKICAADTATLNAN